MTRRSADLKAAISAEVERHADLICRISDQIMRNPETGYRETRTAAFVAEQLRAVGLSPREGIALTGVRASMAGGYPGPNIAIIGELDALLLRDHPFSDPTTHAAHACGHHAQIASMIGAAIGLTSVIEELHGSVTLFAVPAEECVELDYRLALRDGGSIEFLMGKAELIRLGEFDDIDMAMGTHTAVMNDGSMASVGDSHNGAILKHVRFIGRSAHAGAFVSDGINALKAANIALMSIDAHRDTFIESDFVRLNSVVANGGDGPTVVPAESVIQTVIRAENLAAMRAVSARFDQCIAGAATAMGAKAEVRTVSGYMPHRQDPSLVKLAYSNCAAVVGDRMMGSPSHQTGSTDFGDLCQIMPVVHPRAGGVSGHPHSMDYRVTDHYAAAVNPAKSMAMTIVDLLSNGAETAKQVQSAAGPKLNRCEYLALRRSFDTEVYM